MNEIDLNKPNFFIYNGTLLRNRIIICIWVTSVTTWLMNMMIMFSAESWKTLIPYYLFSPLTGSFLGWLCIRYHRRKIQENRIHYHIKPIGLEILIKLLFLYLAFTGLVGLSSQLSDSKLEIIFGFFFMSYAPGVLIGQCICYLWLTHYEKQHGSVYEVNDFYAEKSQIASSN